MGDLIQMPARCVNAGQGCAGRVRMLSDTDDGEQMCEECRARHAALLETPPLFTDLRPRMLFQPLDLTPGQRDRLAAAFTLIQQATDDCVDTKALDTFEELQSCMLEMLGCQTPAGGDGRANG